MEHPEIFISYAWRDESVTITEELDAFFQSKGITILRDNRDIGYKGLIKEYMQRLGRGKYVVVVLSDQYFKSKSCMYELLQLSRHEDFYDRIFPVTVEGTRFYEAEDALHYARYWDERVERLQEEIRSTKNIANLQGITDDLNLYVEIRQNITRILDFLRNINTHPLKGSDFDLLFQAIQAKIIQDQASEEGPPKTSTPQAADEPQQTIVVVSGEGRRWACLIGANDCDDPALPELPYPEENVEALAQLLEDKRRGDFDQVVVLKGKTNTEVIREIKRISTQLKMDDLLLLYFSGYALFDEEETEKLYLVTTGTDPADLPGSAIDLDRVKTFLEKSQAIQKILILDCHYRGQRAPYQVADPGIFEEQLRMKGQGKFIISSPILPDGSDDREGTEIRLTQCLLEGLTTGNADLDNSGKVGIGEWFTYAQRQMVDRGEAAPLKFDAGVTGNWIVARMAESDDAIKVLPTSLKRNYKYLAEMFRDGNVIPFLGSGIVMEGLPTPVRDEEERVIFETPLERELAQKIAERAEFLGGLQHTPLPVISQYYQTHVIGARPLFYQQLKKLFPRDVRPGPIHRFLVQQERPMLVLTACYDTLLEQMFKEQGKPYAVVTHIAYSDDERNLGKVVVHYSDRPDETDLCLSDELSIDLSKWWVFYKIQGTFDLFIKGLGGQEEIDSIIISEEDYVSFLSRLSDQHRTIPTLFSRLFQQRIFLFLGYRMTAWNLRTIVHVLRREEKIRKIKGYAVRKNGDDFERQYWESKNVQIIDIEGVDFIKGLADEMDIII